MLYTHIQDGDIWTAYTFGFVLGLDQDRIKTETTTEKKTKIRLKSGLI